MRRKPNKPGRATRSYINILLVLVAVVGLVGAVFAGYSVSNRSKQSLLSRAKTLANSLSVDDIKDLTGTEDDLNNKTYLDLKSKLQAIHADNNDTRFIYITGKNEENIFFYVDSENPKSDDYSPPGQVYNEASDQFIAMFTKGEALAEGPTKDQWGTWISALAPIKDRGGDVVAVVGIDSPATNYYLQAGIYSALPILLALVLAAVLLRFRRVEGVSSDASRLKSHFGAIASDELRSPMMGVLWALDNLQNSSSSKNLTTNQNNLLAEIKTSTEFALSTTKEILDVSFFERGHTITIQRIPLDVVNLLKNIERALSLVAKERGLSIKLDGDWPKKIMLIGDKPLLQQTFVNIINNSIRYTVDSSDVLIGYQYKDNSHIIYIKDSGIGIPEVEQGEVLEGGYRGTNAKAIQPTGSGFGLWFAYSIIQQHGGKLWIESGENTGTTVYISLPEEKEHKLSKIIE